MYFDCVCCGTTDMSSDENDPALCDSCKLCECGEEGDNPNCKECLIDGANGIYVPQVFAQNFEPEKWGVDAETIAILLAGPDHEQYWDAWGDVEGYVERDWDGKRWVLCQDGDLWAQCVGKASKTE